LGYPAYFGNMLVVFKVAGALALMIPQVPRRVKEWAYAGFAFDFIAAAVSLTAVDGVGFLTFFPLIFLVLLILSYISYHKKIKAAGAVNAKQKDTFNKELAAA